jgi:hypothetical protein
MFGVWVTQQLSLEPAANHFVVLVVMEDIHASMPVERHGYAIIDSVKVESASGGSLNDIVVS